MKILVLTDNFPPFSRGGAEMATYRLATSYVKDNYHVVVVTTVQNREEAGQENRDGFRLYKIYANYHERWRAYLSLYNPTLLKKLAIIIKEEEPDLVHAHNIHKYFSYHCLRTIKKMGGKLTLTVHDCMPICYKKFTCFADENWGDGTVDAYKINAWRCLNCQRKRYFPFRNFIIRHYINKYPDRIIAVSAELKKLLEISGIRCDEYIHHGIDPSDFKIDNDQIDLFRSRYQLQNRKIIFFGGRISAAKGSNQALKMLSLLSDKIPDVLLLIAGARSAEFDELIKRLNLQKHVLITGWLGQNDLLSAYGVADLVIYPSICFDTFGLINLEAMAMEKPVITTCFGGSKELVIDGVTGYVINPFDIDKMVKLAEDLLNNLEKGRQMGQAGHERFLELFTMEKETQQYLSVFNEING